MRLSLAAVLGMAVLASACRKEEVVEPDPAPAPTPPPPPPEPIDGRDDNMALGNPSGAVASVVMANNYLLVHPQYVVGYDNSRGLARWVSWHLSMAWKGTAERCDCFAPDPLLPTGFFAAEHGDYTNSGFDRGHLCPSDDRDGSDADNAVTFYMSNISPQAPNLNQQVWADLEDFARDLAADGNELYILSGGYGNGGSGSNGGLTTSIAGGNIAVPARYWKVLVVLPFGEDDLTRINSATRVIAVDMPTTHRANALDWYDYRTSVDAIEDSTGLDVLNALGTDLQGLLEVGVDAGLVN